MFSSSSGASEKSNSLIPDKTLALGIIKVLEIKRSQKTNGEYARVEFVITEGEYANRHIWSIIMNPLDANNVNEANRAEGKSDGAKMGLIALTRMFEAAGLVDYTKEGEYPEMVGKSFQELLAMLDGNVVAFKVKVAKGTGGYEDKNEIAEYLSPNPGSGSVVGWRKLHADAASNLGHQIQSNPVAPKAAFVPGPAQQAPKTGLNNGPTWLKRPGGNPY
jgi:hypothetical protein